MDTSSLSKIMPLTAEELFVRASLSEQARRLLAPSLDVATFLERLLKADLFVDSVRLLAFALPVRQGVWWACLAVRTAMGERLAPPARDAVLAAEAWVYKPVEVNRAATLPAAEAAGVDGFAGYAALAAFWSGGSMAPPGLPELKPNPMLSPNAVAAAVLLAGLDAAPNTASLWYHAMVMRGIDIADGGDGRRGGKEPSQ
jgi:hypothetical protein